MPLVHLHEDPQPAALRVRGGSGGSGLSDSQLHCIFPVPRPSPLGFSPSGPLLTASAGLSAYLSRPLCPPQQASLPTSSRLFCPPLFTSSHLSAFYICAVCVLGKKNPGADAPSEAGAGLFASSEWCSDGLTFAFFGDVGAVGSPSRRPAACGITGTRWKWGFWAL